MKEPKLKIVCLLPNVKFEQDQRVYSVKGIARNIKCNGGGNYLIYEKSKKV